MPTWLHDPESLVSLADGAEGPARDWANLRLALRDPGRMVHLPTRQWEVMLAVAIRAHGAVEGVLERVRAGSPGAVDGLDAVLALGALPEDRGPWIEPVRALFSTVGESDRPTVARALCDLGALDREVLATAARGEGVDARTMLPGLVLRWAEAEGMPLDAVAADVAAPLARAEVGEPGILGWAMTVLGLPQLVVPDDVDAAVGVGVRLAGGADPGRPPRGSVRSRARRWVATLLDGRPGPAEALLRALIAHDGPNPAELCALAGWCAFRPDPTDPQTAVVRGAGEDRRLLAAARGIGADALLEPLADLMLASTPVLGLATPLVFDPGAIALRDALVMRAELSREVDASADLGAFAVAGVDPDRVVGWLSDPETRDLGLSYARFAPTMEVLGALLALHVPLDPGARVVYGWALAEMADRAALSVLEAVDGMPAEVVGYARDLLGR